MKPTAGEDVSKASLQASDEVHQVNLKLQSTLSPSAGSSTAGGRANAASPVTEADDEPPASVAKGGVDGESQQLTKAQIQVVFLAFVSSSLMSFLELNKACRLSVAAFLGSLDQTIISTAMPTVASEYNELPQQSCAWSKWSRRARLTTLRDRAVLLAYFDRVPTYLRARHRPIWLQAHALPLDHRLRHWFIVLCSGDRLHMVLLWTSHCR